MSLAMTAATIEDNDMNGNYNNNIPDTAVNKKRQSHNKTQKRNPDTYNFDLSKVNSVLNSIHNRVADDDDNAPNYIGSGIYEKAQHSEGFKPLNPFNPPEKPMSMGTLRTKEGLTNLVPQPADNDALQLQELQSAYMNESQVQDYYKKYTAGQNNNVKFVNQNQNQSYSGDQVLIDKLNYMINLLEEQQDMRTNNVTEEVVLYSFLGVFMIFIVDSFARVGKYVR
jgi:hypothetical protein